MSNKNLITKFAMLIFIGLSLLLSDMAVGQYSDFTPKPATPTALKTKNSGRSPSAELKFRQSGVPVFDLVERKGDQVVKVKTIPALDIGQEAAIVADEFAITLPKSKVLRLAPIKNNVSPQTIDLSENFKPFPVDPTAKVITSPDKVGSVQMPMPLPPLAQAILTPA